MFTLQLFTSFIVGGLLVCLQSFLAERVPRKWRGIALSIPTTMALGFFFIGLTKSPADVVEASVVLPAALTPDYLFVLVFVLLARFNLALSFVGGYLAWALSAYIIFLYPPQSFGSSFWIYFLPFILLFFFAIRKIEKQHHIEPVPVTWQRVLARSLIGGSVITLIVVLSHEYGNVAGGLFSGFPASFTATLLIFYHVHGKKIIPAVAESMFFPGSLGFVAYAAVAAWSFPLYGIWWGTLLSYLGTFLFYILYRFSRSALLPPSS